MQIAYRKAYITTETIEGDPAGDGKRPLSILPWSAATVLSAIEFGSGTPGCGVETMAANLLASEGGIEAPVSLFPKPRRAIIRFIAGLPAEPQQQDWGLIKTFSAILQ